MTVVRCICFAEKHAVRLLEARRHGPVGVGDVVLKPFRSERRTDTRRQFEIFDRLRDAVERPPKLAGARAFLRRARPGARQIRRDS